MGIDLRVAGDVESCRRAAAALKSLAKGISDGGTAFHTARSESGSLWTGQAGNAFRGRMQPVGKSTDAVGEGTHEAGQALDAFTDDLATVTSRMDQARTVATSAGLTVDGDVIHDPQAPPPSQGPTTTGPPPPMTAQAEQAQQEYERRLRAYKEAEQTASGARKIERGAHSALEPKMNAWRALLKDARDQKYWLAAAVGSGTVGTAIAKADKWAEVATARREQAQVWRSVAGKLEDPYDISRTAAQAGVYEKDAAKFDKLLKSDGRFTLGLRGTKAGELLSLNTKEVSGLAGKLGDIAERIPMLGAGLSVVQTGFDIASDKDKSAGSVAKHVGADMGGFVAGTAATEGALAVAGTIGLAGGPVTLAAVGVGIGVAYGVGEVVNHWPEISHWAGNTADDIGHGLGDAGKAVGHFFSSVF
ncbi:MAG: hypothetical protein ACRDRL_15215 [Sciscionella sp.]